MTGKSDHLRRERFLQHSRDLDKFLRQCVQCQERGYDAEKLEERVETLFRENVKLYFKPLVLDSLGRCPDCRTRDQT